MARIPWEFYDPTTGVTELMEVNPNEGASPSYSKNLTQTPTTAPRSRTLLMEGNDPAPTLEFSGAILTESQYNFLLNAWDKRHLVRLTDDLGRSFIIYFQTFNPQRVRSASYPWRHTYSASAVVVTTT